MNLDDEKGPALRYRVVLVEPRHPGNVGAVARLCANFDVKELVLVNPAARDDAMEKRAMHALDFLRNARVVGSFLEAIDGSDFVVGTTAKVPFSDKVHLRNPVDASRVPRLLAARKGLVALAFGREDFGLLTPELEMCDLVATIPTHADYPSLNLSHAVAVVLYELFAASRSEPVKTVRQMDGAMKEALYRTLDDYIVAVDLKPHKAVMARRVVRKLLGRAVPSSWEFFVVMGLLRRAMKRMEQPAEGARLNGLDALPEAWRDEFEELTVELERKPD